MWNIISYDMWRFHKVNAISYLGKSTETSGLAGEFYVKELITTVQRTSNIICDNSFTCIPLAKSLLKSPYNLTLVGTITSNEREIQKEVRSSRLRGVGSAMFCFHGPFQDGISILYTVTIEKKNTLKEKTLKHR